MAKHTFEKAKELMLEYIDYFPNSEKAFVFWKYIDQAPKKILKDLLREAIVEAIIAKRQK